ncbi:hypothetical protein K2F54_10475 [Cryobacterium sp. 1639]|uniref:hypothetical protein n=1 Tax=Cryobacterium inferilacus TaxID=2866629 RepID=UPI001C7305E0|nr:hypothetical protein [Cryobacterium sp. 1639]MBX0300400.1 hypothetical protein [Cryobacterium sp. 1639]
MANLIEKLAESVPSWGAKLAYGERTTVDGHELVPVALVGFGFGGGEGSSEMPEGGGPGPAGMGVGEGRGGGGGGYAVPIGAYVGSADGLQFRPNRIALLVVAVPVITAVGLALGQVIRAFRGVPSS